ncbi:MAG: hypothetical protein K2P84_13005 [Undibacterium sp.]|nr:hypothetical protein [Undibacterium sp.]
MTTSYTYSRSRGTSEGYVSSNNDQTDPGVTSEFDFGSGSDGSYGQTPNERTHSLKVFGTYNVTDVFSIGMNASLVSGRPKSCLGNVPIPGTPNAAFDYYGADGTTKGGSGSYGYSYYCLNGQFAPDTRNPSKMLAQSSLVPRGSVGNLPWTKNFDISLTYKIPVEKSFVTLSATIYNLFNFDAPQTIDEFKDYSIATQAAGRVNLNYGLPTSYQSPRSARVSARYDF